MDYVMISHVSGRYGENGLITLAVVVSLIEFGVVMDGVGMAMQPLIGTYFGEGNPKLIKRVMKSGIKAAIIEGAVATLLILVFAKQFCALFGITDGAALEPSITAIRIVSLGFVFCSTVSLTTSYYMLIDRIGMATAIACFQNGLLYIILPITGSLLARDRTASASAASGVCTGAFFPHAASAASRSSAIDPASTAKAMSAIARAASSLPKSDFSPA